MHNLTTVDNNFTMKLVLPIMLIGQLLVSSQCALDPLLFQLRNSAVSCHDARQISQLCGVSEFKGLKPGKLRAMLSGAIAPGRVTQGKAPGEGSEQEWLKKPYGVATAEESYYACIRVSSTLSWSHAWEGNLPHGQIDPREGVRTRVTQEPSWSSSSLAGYLARIRETFL